MGTAYEALGDETKARQYFKKSIAQPAKGSELSYYQGMSYMRLERPDEAGLMFDDLMRSARQRLEDSPDMDFFQIRGKQSAENRRAQDHYLLGLSYLGRGEKTKARSEFGQALRLNIYHLWARHYIVRLSSL